MSHKSSRRSFLKAAAVGGVGLSGLCGFWIAGRRTAAEDLDGKSPNERIGLASIGIGGKGESDSSQAAQHANMIAFCDIDEQRLARKQQQFPKAKAFTDFRRMFDEWGKQIDAVTVSTPDHTHAVATMMAIKMGKAVYTQKPLTHDVWEARQLRLAAREHKVATQMGNQGTATDNLRQGVEVIRAGAIGPVREVHVWTDRPTGWWPQSPQIKSRPPEVPVPSYVHWDEWLGTAPVRPYAKDYYHPFNWRGWWDFGCGALGDMGCHLFNLPYMALKLGHPSAVRAESEEPNPETYPAWARVTYEFPEREGMPPVKLVWYEGSKDGKLVQPPADLVEKVVEEYGKVRAARGEQDKPANGANAARRELAKKREGLSGGGFIAVGDKGLLYSPGDSKGWVLLPADDFRDYKAPSPSLPRNPLGGEGKNADEGHKIEWLAALKGGAAPLSNFDHAGMLTEFVLLGNVAIRAGGERLEWDGPNLKIPNMPSAEKWLRREHRKPWEL